ncbi:hypothetical protein CEP51_009764 [Fusarium floridanum]|uniref:Prion-inhibition and propagation HeLo domain-containing protein n=1 Tax=Fusarium floridanum TaxID=1325733 RepID=A0A428RGK0_9HYPO|nr:hypothetical protein CEP51_009764 [Fusarium floridanum]
MRVKISYDESKFKQHIQDLRVSIDDLKRLREQAHELHKSGTPEIPNPAREKRPVPGNSQFRVIRQASKALHAALMSAWSGTTVSGSTIETRHTVRLFIDTRVQEDVCMNVVISCSGHGFHERTRYPIQERLTRLQVRSQVRDWIDELNTASDPRKRVCSDDDRRKRRRVRFELHTENNSSEETVTSSSICAKIEATLDSPLIDLCSTDICSVLRNSCSRPTSLNHVASCLGYIDSHSQNTFRHLFYESSRNHGDQCSGQTTLVAPQDLMSMSDILSHSAEMSLSIVEQLKLARNIVSAVLKFYSTPWLHEYFSLYDLSFFWMGQDLQSCLRTLHVGADFVQCPSPDSSMSEDKLGCTVASGFCSAEVDSAKIDHGIRNLTLWSLGTVLLQIGRWSKVAPDDVRSVRKLSSQVPSLGPKYRDLTKKCLECDFGYGDDLSKPRLQQAVYEGLVCELSNMIGSLDIGEDNGDSLVLA